MAIYSDVGNVAAVATSAVGISDYSQVQISITHPLSPAGEVVVIGTGSQDLNPATYESSFVDVLNKYSQSRNKGTSFTVTADGRVRMERSGAVVIAGYADIAHSVNNATVGVVFTVERGGSRILTQRTVHSKMPNAGDIGHLSGDGSTDLLEGDIIGLAVASDKSGNLDIRSSSLVFEYYG